MGTGTAVSSGTASALTGVTAGDWLQLTLNITSNGTPGFFNGSFGVLDYGPNGTSGSPTTALSPVSFLGIGNAALAGNLVAGFRMNEGTNAATATVDNPSLSMRMRLLPGANWLRLACSEWAAGACSHDAVAFDFWRDLSD